MSSLGELLRRLVHKMDPSYDTSNLMTTDELLEGVVECYEPIDPSIYKVKGSITNAGLQALTDQEVGDVWNISDAGTFPIGSNVVWTGTQWDKLSETVTIPEYTAGTGISISDYVISNTAPAVNYTAGTGISISNENVISNSAPGNPWESYTGNLSALISNSKLVKDVKIICKIKSTDKTYAVGYWSKNCEGSLNNMYSTMVETHSNWLSSTMTLQINNSSCTVTSWTVTSDESSVNACLTINSNDMVFPYDNTQLSYFEVYVRD